MKRWLIFGSIFIVAIFSLLKLWKIGSVEQRERNSRSPSIVSLLDADGEGRRLHQSFRSFIESVNFGDDTDLLLREASDSKSQQDIRLLISRTLNRYARSNDERLYSSLAKLESLGLDDEHLRLLIESLFTNGLSANQYDRVFAALKHQEPIQIHAAEYMAKTMAGTGRFREAADFLTSKDITENSRNYGGYILSEH